MLVNFSKKSPYRWKGQLGPNLGQNYATLSDDFLSVNFFEMYVGRK